MRQRSKQQCLAFITFLVLLSYTFLLHSQKSEIDCPPASSSNDEAPLQQDSISVPLTLVMKGEPIQLPQDDPHIINYIWKNKYLLPPSEHPYNLMDPYKDPSMGQGQLIRKLLKNKKNGFFVECGGLDGEIRSNTLFMEQHLGWTGLVVEGDPSNFEMMVKKNRKSWISNACLAVKPYPHEAVFMQKFNQGRILDDAATSDQLKWVAKFANVQCLPLFSLLAAINVTTVDYFSLDVEGSELGVLRTIPFDKVLIRTLSVEYIHTSEGKDELLNFMLSKGFKKLGEVRAENDLANDIIFVHGSMDINENDTSYVFNSS